MRRRFRRRFRKVGEQFSFWNITRATNINFNKKLQR